MLNSRVKFCKPIFFCSITAITTNFYDHEKNPVYFFWLFGALLVLDNNHTPLWLPTISFDPDTLHIESGDTVRLTSIGYHSTTSVDSTDWADSISNHNGLFWLGFGAPGPAEYFVLNTPGKYYYICDPHASMGMRGLIYVDMAQSMPDHLDPDNFSVFSLGNNQIKLEFYGASKVEIYTITGQKTNN